jgi:hypothetical protein
MPRPLQPTLLRLLHGGTAVLVPPAWLTGLFVDAACDGRFGSLPFRLPGTWIDIHGMMGSGKLLEADWLGDGRRDPLVYLDPFIYSVHLLALLLVAVAVADPDVTVLRRLRSGDLPGDWFSQIRRSLPALR